MRIKIILIGGMLLCSGCVDLPALKGTLDSRQIPVLEYFRWAGNLPRPSQEAESARLLSRQNVDAVIQQVQLAILLSAAQASSPEQDDQAMAALDRATAAFAVSPDRIKQDYQMFALIWRDVLEQRRQYRAGIDALRGKVDELAPSLDNTRNKVQILQGRNRELLQRIEALKSIEQQINEREIPKTKP